MIDDWCAGDTAGRLIPQTLIPLWDAELAAAEVRRCADKGSHAIAFSENPVALGLPSVHTGYWDPLVGACEDTETVISMHIGSSSRMITTGPDSPFTLMQALTWSGSMHATLDWVTSGLLERFKTVKIATSEGQVGWMPFVFERLDSGWDWAWAKMGITDAVTQLPKKPSDYVPGRIYGCVYDDLYGLRNRNQIGIGVDQIMYEVDFPHGDSYWPESLENAAKLIAEAGMNDEEAWKFLRGNAIACYGLERFGITR
jgi:predicted TIM-barrel fold metal-dependent hydrolase